MINQKKLQQILTSYKKCFPERWDVKDEKFKWQAVQCFQDNWDIDAEDFPEMLKRSLAQTDALLDTMSKYPRKAIIDLANVAPEEVRAMFCTLFDESEELYPRVEAFKKEAELLLKQHNSVGNSHFQDENAISVYLWLRYPDKCYIYKFMQAKTVAEQLEANYHFKKGAYADNIRNYLPLYSEVNAALKMDGELIHLFQSHLTEDCYPDPELTTLTFDFCYYILDDYVTKQSENAEPSEEAETTAPPVIPPDCRTWWLTLTPRIMSFSDWVIGKEVRYSIYGENGNKRKMAQNFEAVKAGDLVLAYESWPTMKIVALCRITRDNDGEAIYLKKVEILQNPIEYQTIKDTPELQNMEFFIRPNAGLYKVTEAESAFLMDLIREENPLKDTTAHPVYSKSNFLQEVYLQERQYNVLMSLLRHKKNIILQGAPGVGKTFAAKRLAYAMMGEINPSRIEMIQFHQNYSYEDFIMGYRPEGNGFKLTDGIFYRFCQRAANDPDHEYFFIIDEINRGNMSKIFGELLMLIEKDYRGTKLTLAYSGLPFSVPENLYLIGMMNTADRSLAMIDYALRRRFSFFEMTPGFNSDGFRAYQESLENETFNSLIRRIQDLNAEIERDPSLGRGFQIGHSYFCGQEPDSCTTAWMQSVVEFDILPMLREYWFDEPEKVQHWESRLRGVFDDEG